MYSCISQNIFDKIQTLKQRGESRGLVVKAEDSQLSGCRFKPRRRVLDGVSKASYYKWKNEVKEAEWGTPKKTKNSKIAI